LKMPPPKPVGRLAQGQSWKLVLKSAAIRLRTDLLAEHRGLLHQSTR